jgi:hypothetical protein
MYRFIFLAGYLVDANYKAHSEKIRNGFGSYILSYLKIKETQNQNNHQHKAILLVLDITIKILLSWNYLAINLYLSHLA